MYSPGMLLTRRFRCFPKSFLTCLSYTDRVSNKGFRNVGFVSSSTRAYYRLRSLCICKYYYSRSNLLILRHSTSSSFAIQPPHPSPFNLLILRHSTSSSFAIQPPHPSLFNLLILRYSTLPSLRPDGLTEGRLR